ncbi:lipid II:glycine glycyltransferase FemX [Flexivirga caeni]|uniref:Peptidoglycan bridge formation glycyltransferase FemA/FemB family protein n=1 Tax=Flexivirga caeni TaxID=2294115 RepID=A0A3M9MI69_9MICO|nr:GNAT family N-acetyltransferase [Flexivirga caeni]RNI24358.1 peptidoglycan bridge formation glycyltransferase FemA/FemB family protein [Flexivirga caeni]
MTGSDAAVAARGGAELSVRQCTAAEFVDVVHAAGRVIPVEQSPQWARYDDVLPGRAHWRFLVVSDGDAPMAALSLSAQRSRLLDQLWAKRGPVWLDDDRSAARERALREALAAYIRAERPSAGLLRLHTEHAGSDLVEPLVGVSCDRTVLLDLTQSEEDLLAGMSQNGRRNIRKALKNDGLVFADETAIGIRHFETVMYPIFEETARRDGFVLRPWRSYYEMLRRLGPDTCRLFTVRDEGSVVAWTLVTEYDGQAGYYFAASADTARDTYAVYRLVWGVLQTLQAEGAESFDFCGAGSDRAPSLLSLNRFKLNFGRQALLEVPGPWDVVLRPNAVRLFHTARSTRTALRHTAARARALRARQPMASGERFDFVE